MISVAVMAHPRRAALVDELLPQLPGATVAWDERSDHWDTRRRSLLAMEPGADWQLVVQDDAVLCADFLAGAHEALAAVPATCPVSFFMARGSGQFAVAPKVVERAVESGRSWIAMEGPWWGVAVAIPAAAIPDLVAWCDTHTRVGADDRRMTRYFLEQHVECWYSVPSLVDHLVGDDHPSMFPGRENGPSRVALRYIGDGSPLEIDWQTPPVRRERSRQPAQRRRGQPSKPSPPTIHPRR